MEEQGDDSREETEIQSDPSWDYYHRYLKERDENPASSFERFLESVPASLREKVREKIADLEFTESLLSGRREEAETPTITGFDILRTLGRGGMGRVYLARRIRDAREVALKVFRSQPIFEKRARVLFAREVAAIEALDHPNIGKILDKDPSGQGQWLAMEYIDGVSFSFEIHAQRDRLGKVPADRTPTDRTPTDRVRDCLLPPWDSGIYVRCVAKLMLDIAKALAHAHERGVYHRDVKPGNILIQDPEHAILVDFGLAKIMEDESRTGVGDLLGTLGYMSPEQILARRVPIDHRTDFWSLGVTFYQILALQRPFEGETYEEVHRQVCFEEALPLAVHNPRVPRDLSKILERCLQKNPRHRFDSANDIVLHLEEFLQHRKSSLPALPLSRRFKATWRRHRILASSLLLTCLLLVSMATAWIWSRTRAHMEMVQTSHAKLLAFHEEWSGQGVSTLEESRIRGRIKRVQEILAKHGDDERGSGQRVLAIGSVEGQRRLALGRKLLKEGALSGAWNPKDGKIPDPVMIERGRVLMEGAGVILDGDRARFADEIHRYTRSWMTIHRPDLPGIQGEIRVRQSHWVDKQGGFTKPAPFQMEFGRPFTLPSGIYRFEIQVEGYGAGEFVRRLTSPGEQQELRPRILNTRKVIAEGMSLIEGGDCIVGGNPRVYPYRRHRIRLPSFYMDTHEVTVGEFLAFMEATGCPPPRPWPKDWKKYLPLLRDKWARHPMTQVNLQQARAYAEWMGKRLPSAFEWERAARGKEGKEYLWGEWSDLGFEDKFTNTERLELSKRYALITATLRIREQSTLVRPLKMLYPVGSFEADQTAEGIFDLLGNATEMTETPTLQTWSRMDPATFVRPNILIPSRTSYLIKGSNVQSMWSRKYNPVLTLSLRYFTPSQGSNFGSLTGFRCVKSIPR